MTTERWSAARRGRLVDKRRVKGAVGRIDARGAPSDSVEGPTRGRLRAGAADTAQSLRGLRAVPLPPSTVDRRSVVTDSNEEARGREAGGLRRRPTPSKATRGRRASDPSSAARPPASSGRVSAEADGSSTAPGSYHPAASHRLITC